MLQAYAGKVRTDIDHNAYKPAAWRVDSYLDEPDDEDLVGSLKSHRLVFSKDNGAVDAMARQEKLDDYKVDQMLSMFPQKWIMIACTWFNAQHCRQQSIYLQHNGYGSMP